jgi:hypothetical protein
MKLQPNTKMDCPFLGHDSSSAIEHHPCSMGTKRAEDHWALIHADKMCAKQNMWTLMELAYVYRKPWILHNAPRISCLFSYTPGPQRFFGPEAERLSKSRDEKSFALEHVLAKRRSCLLYLQTWLEHHHFTGNTWKKIMNKQSQYFHHDAFH